MKITIWVALFFVFIHSGHAAGGSVIILGNSVPPSLTNVPPLTNVVAVSAGLNDALALQDDGTVAAWGNDDSGVTNIPDSVTNVVAISSGWLYHMALRADGTVVTWGSPTVQVPDGLSNVVAIAAGGRTFCLALLSNRTIFSWGFNGSGQTNVPSDVTNVIAVAAGLDHSMALLANGTVAAWGDNTFGACNVPPNLTNVVAISAGWSQSLALRSDGTVVGWGDNVTNSLTSLTNVVVMAAGWDAGQDFILHDGTMPAYGLSNAIAAARGNVFAIAVIATNSWANTVLLSSLSWTNSHFSGVVSTRYNRVYGLEYRDHLTDPHWSYLDLSAGNGGMLRLQDATATVPQRFYRATRW